MCLRRLVDPQITNYKLQITNHAYLHFFSYDLSSYKLLFSNKKKIQKFKLLVLRIFLNLYTVLFLKRRSKESKNGHNHPTPLNGSQ